MFESEPDYTRQGGSHYTPPWTKSKRKKGRWRGPFLFVLLLVLVAVTAGVFLS